MTHSCNNILPPRATNTAWDRSFPSSHPQCRSSPIFSSHKYTPTIFPLAKYTLPIFFDSPTVLHHSSIYFINIPPLFSPHICDLPPFERLQIPPQFGVSNSPVTSIRDRAIETKHMQYGTSF